MEWMILLEILKWIGIVLACIVGLLLAILLLVLFVPIKYSLKGEYVTGNNPFADFKASWLLSLVSFSFSYHENKTSNSLKICGISKKNKKKTKENDEEKEADEAKSEEESEKKNSPKRKIYGKIKKGVNLIQSDEFSQSLLLFRKKFVKLVIALLPKRSKVSGSLGFENPETTGKVCAYLGMLYPLLPKGVNVVGDFENPTIDVHAKIKGHIFIYQILFIVISFVLNRNVRALLKMIKTEDAV